MHSIHPIDFSRSERVDVASHIQIFSRRSLGDNDELIQARLKFFCSQPFLNVFDCISSI